MGKARVTTEYDEILGARVKSVRIGCGYTQSKLADAMGISFQQVQKYETGMNRISVSRLHDISTILGIPMLDFIKQDFQEAPLTGLEFRLIDAARKIPESSLKKLVSLAEAISEASNG